MSSGEQANQQPPAIENFLIVAYRSLRKREKVPTRTNAETFPELPPIVGGPIDDEVPIAEQDYKVAFTHHRTTRGFGPREHDGGKTCWIGFAKTSRCIEVDMSNGKTIRELTCDEQIKYPLDESVRSVNWARFKDLFIQLTNLGIVFYKHKAGTEKLVVHAEIFSYHLAPNYMQMSSPNLGRNLQITSRGFLLFVSSVCTVSGISLETVSKSPPRSDLSAKVFTYSFVEAIAEFVACHDTRKQKFAVMTQGGQFFTKVVNVHLNSRKEEEDLSSHSIKVKLLANERITCFLEVPGYHQHPTPKSDGRGWLTGSLTSDTDFSLCVAFRHHQTLEPIDRINLMKYGSGMGPLHSIRAVPGSKWAVYLVFSDLSYFHLISLTRQKLGIIQGKISVSSQPCSSAAFWVTTNEHDKEFRRDLNIVLPRHKSGMSTHYALKLP